MAAVTGEITTMLELLGAPKDDERIMRSLEGESGFREQEAFVDPARGDDERVTIHNRSGGFEYRFLDGALDKIVIHAQQEAHWDAFPRPTELIDGLDISTAGQDDVVRVLGEAWKSDPEFTKHKLGKRYLHTSYLNGRISRMVVMAKPR